MIDRIQARRNELAAQIDAARLMFADLEIQRDQAIRGLSELQRHLDGMAGGMQELDALLVGGREDEGRAVEPGAGEGGDKEQDNHQPDHAVV